MKKVFEYHTEFELEQSMWRKLAHQFGLLTLCEVNEEIFQLVLESVGWQVWEHVMNRILEINDD